MAAELAATRSERTTSDRIGSPGDDVRTAARVRPEKCEAVFR